MQACRSERRGQARHGTSEPDAVQTCHCGEAVEVMPGRRQR